MTSVTVERRRLRVRGVVQGVGFRPFVHRLASELGLAGFVGNDTGGVFAEIEGPSPALDTFERRLRTDAPRLASVTGVDSEPMSPNAEHGFHIVASAEHPAARTALPPDVATCPACLADMRDPRDRRYRYPFTNCSDCGPRLSVITGLPYDRPATTMAGFTMCAGCEGEYLDPADRRFHAEPIACPACGPQLTFGGAGGEVTAHGTDAALAAFHASLARGETVAVKGIGGYHLACDATDEKAVARLRERKQRLDKPFALLVPDMAGAQLLAHVDPTEAAALESMAAPIVLLRRRAQDELPLTAGVAPHNPWLGIMLASSPLQHLLFQPVPGSDIAPPRVLVLTSGNLSDEPIAYDDTDAHGRLGPLVDAFLTHDRPIAVPVDDSVVRVVDSVVQPVRRSRGYAPIPIALPVEVAPVLAVGGELKNTFCLASGRQAWVSQHIGDMENLTTLQAFEASVAGFERMYRVAPDVIGVDAHPGYMTRRWARERRPATRRVEVQHHHAHVVAAMAEHGVPEGQQVLGVAFDGTGYAPGQDGEAQLWGGELLIAGYRGFSRPMHLRPLPLPGGDGGVRNPCRIAVAYMHALGIDATGLPPLLACDEVEAAVVRRQVDRGLHCVPTTSVGRLFDAVASMLDVRHRTTYEAQAAIELEDIASTAGSCASPVAFEMRDGSIDPEPVLRALVAGIRASIPAAQLALGFHVAVADMIDAATDAVLATHGDMPVVLTGGVFQNSLLTSQVRARLTARGRRVLMHRLVPANDAGLALGQAVVAGLAQRQGV